MKTLLINAQNQTLTVRLNRPQVRNAFHPDMIAEITSTFLKVAKEKQIRVVVLSGEGPSFCAGADLEWMKSMAKFTMAQNKKDAEKLFAMFEALEKLPQVLIAKVHGHVMGGALGMLAACDLVVAEEKTEFCFSEAKLGLSPAVISAFVKNKVPAAEMARWFLTADIFSAEQARHMGLIQEVRPTQGVDQVVETWTKSLLKNGPQAVRETKKLLQQIRHESSKTKLKKITTSLIAQLRVSEEGQEGLKSFFEKRTPQWRLNE